MSEIINILDKYGTLFPVGTLNNKNDSMVVDRKYIPDYNDNAIPPSVIQYAVITEKSLVVVDRQRRSVDVVYHDGTDNVKVDRFKLDNADILPPTTKDRIECALNIKELSAKQRKKKR
jgi:hypothetical protein